MELAKIESIKNMLEDFMTDGVFDQEALYDQAVLLLVEDYKMTYDDAEAEAKIAITKIWEEAYYQAQIDLQEAQAWGEARRAAMMEGWV